MIRTLSILAIFSLLAACNGASPDEDASNSSDTMSEPTPVAETQSAAEAMGVEEGVVISVDRLIPEENACLVMMNVVNATDETVTAGLFAFNVTGNDESAGANMFPQTTEPGGVVTAQIILPNADCENAQMIEGGQINCRFAESGESCVDELELRDGVIDFTLND